jgi:DNA-binding NarL/FixJ family response regulator
MVHQQFPAKMIAVLRLLITFNQVPTGKETIKGLLLSLRFLSPSKKETFGRQDMQRIQTRERHAAPREMSLNEFQALGYQVMDRIQEQVSDTKDYFDLLTCRELEVLRLVADGHTDRKVAETLVISPRTVNRHLSNIFVKLDVSGRTAAVAYAIRQGLV